MFTISISSKVHPKFEQPEKKEGEMDPKFWELLLSADKKDYERICAEFGVTDYRWMLKKLNEMKKEREEEQAQVSDSVHDFFFTSFMRLDVDYTSLNLFISLFLKK